MAELLPQFEAARIQSAQASEIARALCLGAAAHLRCASNRPSTATDASRTPRALAQAAGDSPSPRSRWCASTCRVAGGLRASADFGGRRYRGGELEQLAHELERAHFATKADHGRAHPAWPRRRPPEGVSLAGTALRPVWCGRRAEPGVRAARGRRRGAVARPQAAAHRPPARAAPRGRAPVRGHGSGGVDLLAQPARVRATILEFAEGKPVHFGLHAFASGKSGPLLVSLTMNEIRAQPAARAGALGLVLVVAHVGQLRGARRRGRRRRASKRRPHAAPRAGCAPARCRPAICSARQQRLSCAVVPAAGRELSGRRVHRQTARRRGLASYGNALDGGAGHAVFANMAPITDTRSLASPLMRRPSRRA